MEDSGVNQEEPVYIEYVHMRPRRENLLNGLAKALGFGAPELMENRKGHLHAAQSTRFIHEYIAVPMLGVMLSIVTPVVFRFIWASVVEQRPLDKFFASLLAHPSSFLM